MKKVLLVALLLPALALAAESPFAGTWKIDLGKVQFPQKPETWVLQNGRYQCITCVPTIDVKADGTDQPTPGSPDSDTLAVKVVDDKTVEFTARKGGKVVSTERSAVSADGKTLTTEFTEYPEASKQPITGKGTMARVAPAPPGSHATSGSWRAAKVDALSDNALIVTYVDTADGLAMTAPTGESFDAKFDGRDYPVKGGRVTSTVSLRKVNDRTIEQTTKRDGKVVMVDYMAVSADGKTLTVKSEDREHGTTTTFVAVKQ
jgi:hypothetical protein